MGELKVLSAQEAERLRTSPEYVRVSVAAAMTLGLKTGRMYRDAVCRCVNLLLHYPQGCWANCTYCGLARERPGVPVGNTFIRVTWPLYPTDLVVDRIAAAGDRVGRVCIAQVQDKRAYPDLLDIGVRIRRKSDVPISALVSATLLNEERLRSIQEAGQTSSASVSTPPAKRCSTTLEAGVRAGPTTGASTGRSSGSPGACSVPSRSTATSS